MKILLCLQFGRAIRAAGYVLLQFIACVVRQLAVNVKHDILFDPFTLHSSTFIAAVLTTRGASCLAAFARHGIPTTAYPPKPRAVSAWPGRGCSWRSLPSYAKSLPRSATSSRGNASAR